LETCGQKKCERKSEKILADGELYGRAIPLILAQIGQKLSEICSVLSWVGASIPRIDGIDRDFDRDFPFWQKLAPSLLGRRGSPARTYGAASFVPRLRAQIVGWGIAPSQVSYHNVYL